MGGIDRNYAPSLHHERILPRHRLRRHDRLPPWRKAPAPGPEGAVQDPAVFDLGQVDDAVGLDFDVVGVEGCEQDVGAFFGEGFRGEAVEGARPVYLAGAFVEDDGLVGEAVCEVGNWRGGFGGGWALGILSVGEGGRGRVKGLERTEEVVAGRGD